MKCLSASVAETKKFAGEFVEKIGKVAPPPAAGGGATVVGLSGNLGSGKTTFVQCVAEILGVKEHTTSPTFVIMKSYPLPSSTLYPKPYTLLVHIDAYRLKSGEELAKLGFEELVADPKNLILIEWPENVEEVLPADYIKLRFEFVDETTRSIGIENRK